MFHVKHAAHFSLTLPRFFAIVENLLIVWKKYSV